MKKRTITSVAALLLGMALVLPACNTKKESSSPVEPESQTSESQSESQSESSSEAQTYVVTISNKQALQAEWFAGEAGRKVEISTEPRANIAELIRNGTITITSSNNEVISVSGQMINAVAKGTATVTVASGESSDTVEIAVAAKRTNKEIYGTQHEGTADDPFDNEDAVKVGKWAKDNGDTPALYVKGKIASFYHAPGERNDGAVSWFLEPAEGQTEKFEVYKCYKATGTGEERYLTDDDVWVGGEAIAYGPITYYASGNQAEFTGSTFVSCTGNKPQPRQEIAATVDEALTAGKALEDGAQSWDYYLVTGYVVKKAGNNFFMADSKTASTSNDKNLLELYSAAAPEYADKLLRHAKVTVKMTLKNYHGQVENGLALAAADITVLEEGSEWVEHPEPAVETKTLAEFIAGENVKTVAYSVTAQIKAFKTGDTKDKYGNMTITDGTNDLVMYGTTATASALAWDVYGASYIFTNPQDFLTNGTTKDLTVGTTITLKMIRADYQSTKQGTGVITAVGGQEEQGEAISLTSESLLGYNGSANVAYSTDYATRSIDEVSFRYQQIGAYGAGMQFRNKLSDSNNGTKSNLNNTTALPAPIASIDFEWHSSKDIKTNTNVLKITFGKDNTFATNTEVVMLNTTADVKTMSVTPTGKDFTFVKIEIDDSFTYSCYWNSIKLNLAAGEEQEVAQPVGNFSGHATAADDSQVFVTLALGEEKAYLEVGSLAKITTTYAFDKTTGVVTITDATLGTVTAKFDEANNALKEVTVTGTAAAMIKNNGEITLNGAAKFYNCDGTTAELQTQFKRRYGDPWTVDTGNADRLTSVETAVAGTGMKVRAWTGGRYALNLGSDLESATAFKNIGFWVYNSGTSDVTLNIFCYKGAGFTDFINPGSVTAKAGQWTYCRMGFDASILNFQILDNTKIGTALVYDNIALF